MTTDTDPKPDTSDEAIERAILSLEKPAFRIDTYLGQPALDRAITLLCALRDERKELRDKLATVERERDALQAKIPRPIETDEPDVELFV